MNKIYDDHSNLSILILIISINLYLNVSTYIYIASPNCLYLRICLFTMTEFIFLFNVEFDLEICNCTPGNIKRNNK